MASRGARTLRCAARGAFAHQRGALPRAAAPARALTSAPAQAAVAAAPLPSDAELFGDPFASVGTELQSLGGNMKEMLDTAGEHPVLDVVTQYFFERGGKRFRPTVVLLLARAAAASGGGAELVCDRQHRLAEITEMIHTASLLHDDVVDESDSRRGSASVNAKFGNKVAVLAGDFLLARSSIALARLRDCDVVELLSRVIEELVEGELLQMKQGLGGGGGGGPDADLLMASYLHKTYLKTGSLLANSCRACVMLGEAPGSSSEQLADAADAFGRNLGLAFQLVDDALDFQQSSAALGKPALADMRLGLATAPVLLSIAERPGLLELVERKCAGEGDMEQALRWIEESGGLEKTEALAREHMDLAVAALSCFEPSAARSSLIDLSSMVLNRSS